MSAPQLTAQETVERALAASRADGCIVIATEISQTNLRWANNTLTTNGEMRSRKLAVISVVDGQSGAAAGVIERSAVDAGAIEDLVRRAEKAARDAGPADDAAPLIEPGADYGGAASGWADAPTETSAGVFAGFAPALGQTLRRAAGERRLLFGFAEHTAETTYLGTATGLRLRTSEPSGRLEVNAKSGDLTKSVWAGEFTRDFTDVDIPALDASLQRRLSWADRRVDLEAGRYETLLPPSAVADLMIPLYWSAGARDSDEGRTVFSKKGGGSRLGESLTDQPVTLRSDPAYPRLETDTFLAVGGSSSWYSAFDNGVPIGATSWIDDGVLSGLLCPRSWAEKSGGTPTPFVNNLIMDGAGKSLDEMISSTERGLLLTCLWYIRTVDPQTLLQTGLTRDGVYLIEDGEIAGAVTNFRFNESPVDMLGRITEIGRSEITLPREWNDWFTRTAMPPLRVADFNMSTVSQAS
ncbi:MAG: metallopeptidase TldD-related protein [Mycobacteriales bacterium]